MFELNNIVNEHYTGIFSTTLSVTFYAPTTDSPRPRSADLILPLTTRSKTGSQMLVYPGDANVEVEIPVNAAEAWLEVIATGAAEEVRLRSSPSWRSSTLTTSSDTGVLLHQPDRSGK